MNIIMISNVLFVECFLMIQEFAQNVKHPLIAMIVFCSLRIQISEI
jgi:hypothetical protein